MKPIISSFLFLILTAVNARAADRIWRYQLLEGSTLTDDCPVCDRIPIVAPMRGAFQLRLLEAGPLTDRYAIENIDFQAGDYKVSGGGIFEFGGQLAIRQSMTLTARVDTIFTNKTCFFANDSSVVSRTWPMMAIALNQTNGTISQVFYLQIAAAPIQEIWFSTALSFHSANLPSTNNSASGGDLLSSAGRIVKRNADLLKNFPDSTNDLGLDALDLLPGGEIAFSTDANGTFAHGDFLEAHSGQVFRYQDLLIPLVNGTPIADPGLDALQIGSPPSLAIYFSIERDIIIFQDPGPNIVLRKGDLLWANSDHSQGGILKRQAELLARFQSPNPNHDYGLDAVYIWPSGEIWFSLEEGFTDAQLGTITAGDLLSDQGYVVYRNLELLGAFAPIEDMADFGLDALGIISDAAVSDAAGARIQIEARNQNTTVLIKWTDGGQVFQLERSGSVTGPYTAITPIMTDSQFEDTGPFLPNEQRFYRLRQW